VTPSAHNGLSRERAHERQLSVRLVWPFVRVAGIDPASVEAYARAGYDPAAFANPDGRVPHRLVMETLTEYVARTGDTAVGLRAGEAVDPADIEPLERAARSSPTLRDAVLFVARYVRVMNEAAEISLVEGPEEVFWRFRVTDGVPQPAAANDFILAYASTFARRCVGDAEAPIEVHFMHAEPAGGVDDYLRVFRTPRLKFDMPHNGFVLRRSLLDRALPGAQPRIYEAFEKRARDLLAGQTTGLRQDVVSIVFAQLPHGRLSMEAVARSLGTSVATLRRRLRSEGTTFAKLVDETRRTLAETHLRSLRMSVSEIAFLLGFAHVPAFHAAFRRWTGSTPSAYRAALRGGEALPKVS